MKARRVWVCLGGGLCLAAAVLGQQVLGQGSLPPGLPGLPTPPVPPAPPASTLPASLPPVPIEPSPGSVPSKQISSGVIPTSPPLSQTLQPSPNFTVPATLPATPMPTTPTNLPGIPSIPASTLPPIVPTTTSAPTSVPSTPVAPMPVVPVGVPMTTSPPIPTVPGAPIASPATTPLTGSNTPTTTPTLPLVDIPPAVSSSQYRAPELTNGDTRPGKQEQAVTVEWTGPASARYNQPTNYQILVKNNGPTTVNQVVVKPNLPQDAVVKSSEPPLPQGSDQTWQIGSLSPGQLKKIEVVIQSQRRGYQNYSATVFFAASATHLAEVREPLLNIKMKAPEKGLTGEPAPIQFTIANPGDGNTENIKIKAILPDGLEHPRGQTFEIEVGNLAPKETRTLQLACIAKGHGQMKASLIATADGNLSASDVASFEILLPKLDLVMNGPKLRFVERPARYTMKISNPGSAPANNVVLAEFVPDGFKFQSASNQGRFDENTRTVSWQVGDLQPGQSREISVDLIPTRPGDHKLAAAVQSSRGVRNESVVNTRVEGLSNLILEVSNADNPVEVGADATYEIRLANAGTKAETNVELVCTLPDSVDFRDGKSSAGIRHRVEGRDVIFETLPRLAPRGEVIYRVTVKGRLPGDVRFRARVRAEGMTDALIREESTKFYDDTAVR